MRRRRVGTQGARIAKEWAKRRAPWTQPRPTRPERSATSERSSEKGATCAENDHAHRRSKLQEARCRADARRADEQSRLGRMHHDAQNARVEAKPHAQHQHGQGPAAGAAAARRGERTASRTSARSSWSFTFLPWLLLESPPQLFISSPLLGAWSSLVLLVTGLVTEFDR